MQNGTKIKAEKRILLFNKNKKMLQERADKIDNGTAEYISFEELDILLEETISKYED